MIGRLFKRRGFEVERSWKVRGRDVDFVLNAGLDFGSVGLELSAYVHWRGFREVSAEVTLGPFNAWTALTVWRK